MVAGRHTVTRWLLLHPPRRVFRMRPCDHVGAVERVEQHWLEQRSQLRLRVLEPFYNAVKAVEPGSSSTVIGGTTLGPAAGWWQQLIASGGLKYLNVAAIHPYAGNNDSYEEDGMPALIEQVEGMLAGHTLVVHRSRLVERRRLQLPEPGRQCDPHHDLDEGAQHPRVELLLRRGQLGKRWRVVFVDPDQSRR